MLFAELFTHTSGFKHSGDQDVRYAIAYLLLSSPINAW